MTTIENIDLPVIQPSVATPTQAPAERRPEWLKVKIPTGDTFQFLKTMMRSKELHTVCEEARCPNMAECWSAGTATFMILGDTCTRSCGFCAVKTGRPGTTDPEEPGRVAEAVRLMKVTHAVITSVNRDELRDGGAGIFAETIRQTRQENPGTRVEVLIPDFKGNLELLGLIIERLTGRTPTLIDDDGAPHGKRTSAFWNPPELGNGQRLSANVTTSEILASLAETGMRTLAFSRSRISAELVLRYTRRRVEEGGAVPPERIER